MYKIQTNQTIAQIPLLASFDTNKRKTELKNKKNKQRQFKMS